MYSWLFRYKLIRDSIYKSLNVLTTGRYKKVLDIGCGNKKYKNLIECANYVGIDRFTGHGEGSNPDIISDASALPFGKSCFDFVLCTEVLEHVADPIQVFSEMNRVLAKGGQLVLSTPLFWPVHEAPYDYYRFTEYGLRHLLIKNGFKVDNIIYRGGYGAVATALYINHFERFIPSAKIFQGTFDLFCGLLQYVAFAYDKMVSSPNIYYGCTIKAVKIENTYC
jgi:SAM-dependent methyltransferase